MEANNLFNFGSHPSESANSGLKLSSGDALYANGSTMSFPQQGKNLNGDKNVNGITTVIGTSPSGSRPSTSYSHMSNHHHQESGADYDYLWGQPQYSPGMSVGAGTGVHRKQDPGGLMPQQPQQHFQGHGQYPLNGALTGSEPPSVAAPPNVTVTGGQYWSRESPSQQQSSSSMDMGYNSHGTCGTRTYQNQVRLDMTVQQQQQQQHRQHQQQQQQQRFGVVPNGLPYQHQQSQHPPLPAPQAPIMPPTAQSFVSPRSSPQHHHMSPRNTSSPLPIKVPSVGVPEKGAPQARDNSLSSPRVLSAVMQGCFNETFKEVGNGYNEMQTSVAQSLPKTEALDSKAPMVPPNDSCLGVQHAASDVGHPINKHEVGLKVKDSNPLVASASSESHEPELRVFAKETDTDAILKPELAVLRSKAGAIDIPETDSKMGCHSEEKSDQSPVNSPVASRGNTASGNQASERMSPFVEPPVAGPGALERTGAPLSGCPPNDACGMDEPTNDPFLMESSYTDNSRAATVSHADDTFNGTLDSSCRDSQFTDESLAVGDSTEGLSQLNESQNEDPWQKDETADGSLTTEDSFRGALLDDTSQLEHSMNNGSRSATSPLSSTSDNLECMNNFSTDSKMEEDQHGQDAPDSAVGTARLTFEDRRVAPVRGASKQLLQDKALSSLSPATTPVDLNTGKPVVKKRRVAAPIHDPQNSRLSHGKSTAEAGQGAAKGQNGGGEEEMVGPDKSTEDLPVVFEVPIRSNPKPRPARCPNPLPIKPQKAKRAKKLTAKVPKVAKVEAVMEDLDEEDESGAANGIQRRRIATEEEVNFPLLHGWRREIRVRRSEDRLKGETWYYSPCGRRMKQFPEVIKYLKRHQGSVVSREHFSFSPRMPVGDFYEERESPEGLKWFPLANEEVPSMIMAITGRRGRPPNPDKEKPRSRVRRIQGGATRRPGRPPKPNMIDLLSKVDARLLEKLEAQETLSAEEKEKLTKIKRKMKRKARNISKADAKNKNIIEEKRKVKPAKAKEMKEKEAPGGVPDQASHQPLPEPKKPGRRKRVKAVEKVEEKSTLAGMRGGGARSKAKALAKAQAEAEAQAQAAAASRRQAERRAQAQRRQEERRRQQMILEELKKPTEDMCLTDHQPLPELSRVPGLVLSGRAFSHCLMVVEFLHSYGKVLGLEVPQDVPSLSALQEGLLGLGGRQSEIQDLLVKLVQAALRDPGLPSHYQSVKILGEKLVELELNRSSVSEGLRVFLESHGFEPGVCRSLRSKPFQAHSPDTKASILAFVVDELNGSSIVIRDIDSTLENMAIYRKNKWTIEGKLRKLKTALARRTGRSEADLCLEERRRSARVAEEERLSLEDSGLLERGGRRARREEAKLSEGESPTTASIPELERQIDKLTKRQVFFRKKLLQSSHSLRAVSLGQDRYRRRYWVLPRIGGILVEGPEEILASEDVLVREDAVPLTSPVKKEPKLELPPTPIAAASPPPNLSSPEVDPLPGTASLMSSPRGRGRPRKIKPEVELHLRTAKCRRRRRSSKASGDEAVEVGTAERGMQDLTQSAFLSWLSQTQGSVVNGATSAEASAGDCAQQDSMKEMAEKQGQWFNLLPKTPCDPTSPSADTPQSPRMPPELSASLSQSGRSFSGSALSPQVCSTPLLKLGKRGRRTSNSAQTLGDPCTLGFTIPSATKRRGRPPSKLLQQIEQKYFTQLMAKPIPAAMVRGWWWIREPEELTALLQGLHPRGIREKALHKHLAKHMEFLTEICTRPCSDPIFQKAVEVGGAVSQVLQQPWNECTRAMDSDLNVLQWVEDLEQRVLAADLQIKGFTLPEPDSTREDLQYHEHDVDLLDDWLVKTKKEWSDHLRLMTNPLDLAVLRLANLERNIERTYLKEPLWSLGEVVRLAPLEPLPGEENRQDVESLESEITPRLRAWRQALDRVCSAAQLSLCLLQLERAIAWERSVVKVTCLVCRKGDNDEYLLLCDGCDRGCHMFCLRPKVTQVPEGDWFCPVCTSKENGESPRLRRFPKQKKVRKRYAGGYDSESSDEEDGYRRRGGMTTRRRDGPAVSSHARFSGECGGSSSSPCKRRRMVTRNQPDLTYCEIILMEMESHTDAWPFLEPVNPRLVPGYRRIIKNPMDFLTMRERLLQGGYCSCEEFAADAQLVFNNCQLFNEDTSEVGLAGLSMRRFFESRWAEFYQNKDQ